MSEGLCAECRVSCECEISLVNSLSGSGVENKLCSFEHAWSLPVTGVLMTMTRQKVEVFSVFHNHTVWWGITMAPTKCSLLPLNKCAPIILNGVLIHSFIFIQYFHEVCSDAPADLCQSSAYDEGRHPTNCHPVISCVWMEPLTL